MQCSKTLSIINSTDRERTIRAMKLHQYFEFGPASQDPFSFCQIQLALDTVWSCVSSRKVCLKDQTLDNSRNPPRKVNTVKQQERTWKGELYSLSREPKDRTGVPKDGTCLPKDAGLVYTRKGRAVVKDEHLKTRTGTLKSRHQDGGVGTSSGFLCFISLMLFVSFHFIVGCVFFFTT